MIGIGTERAALAAPAPRRTIVILDIVRWMSALEVVLGHVRDLLFVDFRNLVDTGFAAKLFYFATSFGDEAVIIFFVLSGYLVGGKVVADRRAGRFSWRDYLIDRFSRIYIVLVPALLLTLVCDRVGPRLFAGASVYAAGNWSPTFHADYVAHGAWPVLACNLANLQFFVCPAYGSNGPLWSLGMEWAYYLSFPAGLALLRNPAPNVGYAIRLALVLLIAALGYRVAQAAVLLYPIWFMGIAAHAAAGRRRIGLSAAILGAVALAVSLPATRFGYVDSTLGLYAIGASVALLLASTPLQRMTFAAGANRALADFSYSLYATHFPLALFFIAFLQHEGLALGRVRVSLSGMSVFAGVTLALYGASYLFAQATERRTGALRGWLKRALAARAAIAP